MTTRRRAHESVRYLREWARSRSAGGSAVLPVVLSLPVTDVCNSRCVMCDVWKNPPSDELSPAEFREILADRLFSRVRHVGISGGEPSLRGDLPELARVIVDSLPSLQSISLTTHGFHTQRLTRFLELIRDACRAREVDFVLNLSIDGVGPVHDRVRGVPGAFERVMASDAAARALGLRVQWHCTVSAPNVFAAGELLELARARGAEVIFRQATEIARLSNRQSMAAVTLDRDERSFLADFLSSKDVLRATRSPARRLFYRDLARRLVDGTARAAPCHFQREGVVLDARGRLFQCSLAQAPLGSAAAQSAAAVYFSRGADQARAKLVASRCPGCTHDQSGTWSPARLAAEVAAQVPAAERLALAARAVALVAEAAPWSARAELQRLGRWRGGGQHSMATQGRRALLVGAYGGEHVGDAAILGGVLLRLARDHGVREALVASTRPDRTERWVRSLQTPVGLTVVPAGLRELEAVVGQVDLVAHAGGPLMNLPTLLVRHLEVAVMARRRGIPFLLEGIGIGPFGTVASERIGRELLTMADEIRVRSREASRHPLLGGRAVATDRDPAFDYLETRQALELITVAEQRSLEEVLAATGGRHVVGLNVRPFWKKYTGGRSPESLEERFLDELAAALGRLEAEVPGRFAFRFFPMNADRYGFSDLTFGWRLAQRLGSRVDYRVWNAEPGVDAVLAFLRRCAVVVSMRFHGAIFALSQGRPTIGIDYQYGSAGKVATLLEERGQGRQVLRAETFEADDLMALVQRAVGIGPGGQTT